jgi:hypothetical protein
VCCRWCTIPRPCVGTPVPSRSALVSVVDVWLSVAPILQLSLSPGFV